MSETYIQKARGLSRDRFDNLKGSLTDAKLMLGRKGCVYATGSFGRLEAGPTSDLDLFVVIKSYQKNKKSEVRPLLKETEQILLKRELIVAVKEAKIPEFDGGGRFLNSHPFDSYTKYLGSQEDDYRNTLTGRMLLLLESKSLVSDRVYIELINSVVDAYFQDFSGNEDSFLPSFLFNDIVRMWRTFCVNYEFFRRDGPRDSVKNLKLKYSRMLTCYSAILVLISTYTQKGTVAPADVIEMTSITPTERLELLATRYSGMGKIDKSIRQLLEDSIEDYSGFLELVHGKDGNPEDVLGEDHEAWRKRSYKFGEKLTRVMTLIAGKDPLSNDLYRIVLI